MKFLKVDQFELPGEIIDFIGESGVRELRADGRLANGIVGLYLSKRGFEPIKLNSATIHKKEGKTYRLRVITDHVDFHPSSSKGAGRSIESGDAEWVAKQTDAYLVFDAKQLPKVTLWEVPRSSAIYCPRMSRESFLNKAEA